MQEEPRVVIAVPLATPLIYWRVVASILGLDKPEETDLMVFQGALVDRARNHLVDRMLHHPIEPTHILFLDSDVLPAPDTLVKLLEAEQPIVSGFYRKRLPPHEPVAFVKDKKGNLQPIAAAGRRLQKVDAVGAGCLLIQREVFKKIKGPWFTSEWTETGHLSEDFSFCEKAKKSGYKIYVDTTVTPLHVEPMGIGTNSDGAVRFAPLD